MKTLHNIIIIGAGPIGLYMGSLLEEKNSPYFIIEASDHVGGQLINLYPEKDIVDIPGIEHIKAKEFIALLETKVSKENIVLNETVNSIEVNNDVVTLTTKNNVYKCDNVVISVGLGFSKPRPLGVEHEDEVDNILYSLKDFSFLKGKKVAIFGGGDSALDWAKEISSISDHAHLIHRRLEFRGNPETIKDCHNLAVHLPYVPASIEVKDNHALSVSINKVIVEGEEPEQITIPVDYILVNYGNVPVNSPFDLSYNGAFIKVNELQEAKERIYAIGDACDYENKKRRIAPGMIEAQKIIDKIS